MVDTENLSHKDLTVQSKKMDELVSENESLRGEVQALQLQVATLQKPVTNSTGMSEKEASSRIAELEKENGRLTAENQRLTKLSLVSSQVQLVILSYNICATLLSFVLFVSVNFRSYVALGIMGKLAISHCYYSTTNHVISVVVSS